MVERGGTESEGLPDLSTLSSVSNVLVLAPEGEGTESCLEFLTQSPPEKTRILAVTYDSTAQEWIDKWTAHAGDAPARGGIVSIGQSEAEIDTDASEDEMPGQSEANIDRVWSVSTVEDPGDLTGVGIEMSELLSDITRAQQEDERIVVCFDSLTDLLGHADLERTFRFLHVATGRVDSGDALGYYNLAPDAHGQEAVTTLQNLFDVVLRNDDEGWTVDE